ncbi:hypothetical protein LguiA_030253 [Lonicera macranthoides]
MVGEGFGLSSIRWCVATTWDSCKQLFLDMEYYCSHIYREGNTVANPIDSIGLNQPTPLWWESAPQQTITLVGRDMSIIPNYFRFH